MITSKLYQTLFYWTALCGTLAGCSDDDWKDDVEALQRPVPAGMVMLDDAGTRVVKGNSFQVKFRVNPSGVSLTKEDVELDVRNSDTYIMSAPSEGTQIRASYVTPSDYYELVDVQADRNQEGEPLEGQWVATIQTKGEANFRNVSDLYLVARYTDAAGQTHRVSSTDFPVEIVPTVDEGISFNYVKAQTLTDAEGQTNPYIVFVDVNAYKNDRGEMWIYDRSFISAVETTENQEELTADTSPMYEAYYLSFTPDRNAPVWESLEKGEVKTASSDIQVELTDFGQTTKTLEMPVTYCPSSIEIGIDVSASQINAALDEGNSTYQHELSDALSAYGLTPDVFAGLKRLVGSGSQQSEMDTFPMLMNDLEVADYRDFRPLLSFWVADRLVPGTSNDPATDPNTIKVSVVSMPQELEQPRFILFNLDISLIIHVTD